MDAQGAVRIAGGLNARNCVVPRSLRTQTGTGGSGLVRGQLEGILVLVTGG